VRSGVVLLIVSVCGLVGSSGTAAASHANRPSRWLSWNATARTASLTLIAGYGRANNGFNFDGHGRGEILVRIPVGWRVTVTCRNASSIRHSCAIVRGTRSAVPAFHGAATRSPITGLPSGATARFSFAASRLGTYRIACLVPGHEEAREWDVLDVVRARRPSISVRTG